MNRTGTCRAVLAALLIAMSLAASAVAGPLEDAMAAYEAGDYSTAAVRLRPLADAGNGIARINLGVMYTKGEGVPQDYVEAHKWFNLAASDISASNTGHREKAIKNRDLVASKMTPEQIATAEKLAAALMVRRGIGRLSGNDPAYPRAAIRAGVKRGSVLARIHIDEAGNVYEVIIVRAEPPKLFDGAVVDALSRWVFSAAGEKYVAEVEVGFELK